MTSETNSHVSPEPIEAPEPQPVRTRDLVRGRALLHGWNVCTAEGPELSSFSSFKAGVQAFEDYMLMHDRRASR